MARGSWDEKLSPSKLPVTGADESMLRTELCHSCCMTGGDASVCDGEDTNTKRRHKDLENMRGIGAYLEC